LCHIWKEHGKLLLLGAESIAALLHTFLGNRVLLLHRFDSFDDVIEFGSLLFAGEMLLKLFCLQELLPFSSELG